MVYDGDDAERRVVLRRKGAAGAQRPARAPQLGSGESTHPHHGTDRQICLAEWAEQQSRAGRRRELRLEDPGPVRLQSNFVSEHEDHTSRHCGWHDDVWPNGAWSYNRHD